MAYPAIPELPKESILAMEKEIIGFYVTGHPLDQYRDIMKSLTAVEQLHADGVVDGQSVKIAGLIASAKRLTTKNNDMMCFVGLEDFTGVIEAIVFPRVFEKVSRLLLPDMAVLVTGRLAVNEEGVKVLVQDMKPLGDAEAEVRIRINKQCETADVMTKLKEIFLAHRGKTAVYLHLTSSSRVIKTEPTYWITPSAAAKRAIEELVGKETVSMT